MMPMKMQHPIILNTNKEGRLDEAAAIPSLLVFRYYEEQAHLHAPVEKFLLQS